MKYFAYGSNCSPAILEKKRVAFTSARPAVLAGYRLRFNKMALRDGLPSGLGYANINEDCGGKVEGVLYEIVDQHLDRLDQSERYPDHYGRIDVTVQSGLHAVRCISYQARHDKIADGLRPPREYLNHVLEARDFVSWQYFETLRRSEAFEDACGCCGTMCEVHFVQEADRVHMLCRACTETRQR
ncbi:gamma-glutamylcyclotransferase family protein [Stieleria mannarensis]|uniref:gamma-glutamylcyclotransferase family protein n=1 Tax=Stieleria mannarensis TaxID=2755585 RepID=UPI001601471D|nr:gamma-glutamylcyclotransferase family protein [Rhodopirellula sp. JC639]